MSDGNLDENTKIHNYAFKYKKIMNRYYSTTKNKKKKKEDFVWLSYRNIYPIKKINFTKEDVPAKHIRNISTALKNENYTVRKSFIDNLLDDNNCRYLHHIIFYEIAVPVFITEYKNQNAKYIEWIGRYDELYPFTRIFLEQIGELFNVDYNNIINFKEYFLSKAFMINKDRNILERLMNLTHEEYQYSAIFISLYCCKDLDEFKKSIKPFADRLEKCKQYCKIAGLDIWPADRKEDFDNQEIFITSCNNYIEHVEKNGYISFSDYRKITE